MSFLRSIRTQSRAFSSSSANLSKVAVLGANGGIGQPLSLLLKLNPNVTELSLFDLRGTVGVGADLSHINTNSSVKGFTPEQGGINEALKGAEVVVIPAGVPRKPGMTRDDLFNTNASIVRDLAKAVADNSPNAFVLVISNPVNSTVPIVAEVLKSKGVYDPKRLFGVTTLDVLRASRFISEVQNTDPTKEAVTVVGGHSGVTIVPLISQSNHPTISGETLDKLVHRIQFGGDEVVQAKDGAGSATLSMAQAAARFTGSLLEAIKGKSGVVEPSFVESPLFKSEGIDFFSSKVTLGPSGAEKIHDLGKLNEYEQKLIEAAKVDLIKNIKKGKEFVAQNP
jgi:malate dehydrogenase